MNAVQRSRLAQWRRVTQRPRSMVLIDADGELYSAGDTVRVTSVRSTALFRTAALGTVTHVVDDRALVTFDDGYVAVMDDGYEVRLMTGFATDFGRHTGRWKVWAGRAGDGRVNAWYAGPIVQAGMPVFDMIASSIHAMFRGNKFSATGRKQAIEYARAQARKNLR